MEAGQVFIHNGAQVEPNSRFIDLKSVVLEQNVWRSRPGDGILARRASAPPASPFLLFSVPSFPVGIGSVTLGSLTLPARAG